MAIGAKNRRLTLQQPDGIGGYDDVDTVWGSKRFLGGTPEAIRAGAAMAIGQWEIKIWYRTDVKAEWRLVDIETAQTFQISGYGDAEGKKRELQLMCSEIQ